MNVNLRTTKFPYIFWSFNKAYECKLDFHTKSYENLQTKTSYSFKAMNFYVFLALKYLPVCFLFYFAFSVYDFYPSKNTISAYILALFLALIINFLDNFERKIGVGILVVLTLILSYVIRDLFLIAYVFKYFILLSVFIIFYLDLHLRPFCLTKNNKVISNFLVPKTLLPKEK